MSSRPFVLAAAAALLLPYSVQAQAQATAATAPAACAERLCRVDEGDGRIHGAPTMPVTLAEMHPGQVQTLNLHPRYHAVLEFPYPVLRVDAGDPKVFAATIVGSKMTLKATRARKVETTMSIILADADMTVLPFIIRADSTQPFMYVVRYTDPVAKHLNAAEASIAARLQADTDRRVSELAEARLQQRLLLAGDVIRLGRSASVGAEHSQMRLAIESAQQLPADDGRPRTYLRYRVDNRTVAPLNDLYFTLRIVTKKRRFLLFSKTSAREVYDVQDVRTDTQVAPAGAVAGLLILDDLTLGADDALSVEAIGFNNQRRVRLDRVLVGRR